VNLGFENRNKAIGAIVIAVIALAVVVWELWPGSSTPPSAKLPVASTVPASGKKGAAAASTLDPTLRYDLLKESEGTKYEGNGKNIFVAGMESIPAPKTPGILDHQPPAPAPAPTGPPPPPPIPLVFYGFASQHGSAKQVFLKDGDDIFIAKEGDIVDRRYKVIHIYPMAVEVEDVLNNNVQQIPLTQS